MYTAPTTRTYLVALVDGGGTVPPELGVVRRLVARGHDVTVLAEDTMAEEVAATGATFRPWVEAPNRPTRRPEDDPYRDWECKNPLQLFDRILETQLVGPAAGYAADLEAAIGERRPDAVVCSLFALGAMVAAEGAGIPFAVLMANAYVLPAPGMPPFGLGLKPASGPAGRLRDRAISAMTARWWTKGLPPLNALRASRGLAPVTSIWEQAHRAHREVVLTSTAFDFPAEVPPNVRYVGPVLDDPAWAEGTWSPPSGTDPLVLVALSSTFQDQGATLQRIVDAMATLPVRALVTTGPALEPAGLTAPPNVTVVAAAPHQEVLRHASAVVTHGGHGTVVKALAAGVPLVVLPFGRDQADNAARVTTRGAGVSLKRTATAPAIADAVRTVLDEPEHRRGAERLGSALRQDAASDALVTTLEELPTLARA